MNLFRKQSANSMNRSRQARWSLWCLMGATLVWSRTAHGQFYPTTRNLDLCAGATERYTTAIPSKMEDMFRNPTILPGVLVSVRFHPKTWAGLEVNYKNIRSSKDYSDLPGTSMDVQEVSAAFLFHTHFRRVQPFVAVGGGELFFNPKTEGPKQRRPGGLLNAGVDLPLFNPHFGFSLQGHSMWYHPLSLTGSVTAQPAWIATAEPSASVYVRF